MTPILETTAVALVYILLLQPFYLLEILPFWGFLEEEKKKPFCRAWVALTVAETALTVGLVRSGLFPSEPAAYWAIGYIVWLPQFLLSFWPPGSTGWAICSSFPSGFCYPAVFTPFFGTFSCISGRKVNLFPCISGRFYSTGENA